MSNEPDQNPGLAFVAKLEFLRKEDQEWRTECRRWHSDLVNAIYADGRAIELRGGSLDAYLRKGGRALQIHMLERLRFLEMRDRDERIAPAYEHTFTWVFEDNAISWVSFAGWLKNDASDSQLYWIAGKPASGKSTLMKYICTSRRTRKLLALWASPLRLVMATFYFWNSGAEIQMSQVGLLRSLLFQILNDVPDLLPRIFPERWEVASLFGLDHTDFSIEELRKAFSRLTQCTHDFKFCFFIDGLDEFAGDHMELVNLVVAITAASNIKICVASRPWTVFEEASRARPYLLLQDLTKRDIDHYVGSHFRKDSNFTEFEKHEPQIAQSILEAIVQKAAGVFLWVHLVTVSLLNGLRNGDRVTDLRRRLDILPDNLLSLYEKIIQSLDPFYYKHALQYFDLVKSSTNPLTLLDFSYADEEPGFVMQCKMQPLSADEQRYRAESMRRRLNSRCRGLLEVAREGFGAMDTTVSAKASGLLAEITDANEASCTVQYLHRTVKDYLEDGERWSMLIGSDPWTYDPHMAICRSLITQFKVERPEHLYPAVHRTYINKILSQACRCEAFSSDSSLNSDYVLLLQEFDVIAQSLQDHGLKSNHDHWADTLRYYDGGKSLLSIAVTLDLQHFVKAKVQRGCLEKQGNKDWPLLYDAVRVSPYLEFIRGDWQFPSLGMIKLLLSNMADPNYSRAPQLFRQPNHARHI